VPGKRSLKAVKITASGLAVEGVVYWDEIFGGKNGGSNREGKRRSVKKGKLLSPQKNRETAGWLSARSDTKRGSHPSVNVKKNGGITERGHPDGPKGGDKM